MNTNGETTRALAYFEELVEALKLPDHIRLYEWTHGNPVAIDPEGKYVAALERMEDRKLAKFEIFFAPPVRRELLRIYASDFYVAVDKALAELETA
jgi:hypothetical protein